MDQIAYFQGITTAWKKISSKIFSLNKCCYKSRLEIENNNFYKQVLTYGIVRRGTEVLSFRRGTYNWTEEYLKGSLCIDSGGHVTEEDCDLFNMADLGVRANILRELSEELVLPEADKRRLFNGEAGLDLIGPLNDDSSDVGRRHFAFVFQYTVSSDKCGGMPCLRGRVCYPTQVA
ncbi:MAG: hypothetical protein U1F77_04725 [Kiritimatiellia bacterium]